MGKNVYADGSDVYTKSGSTEFKVIGSTGDVYAGAVNFVENGSTGTNLKAYGLSRLTANSSGADSNKYTIDAPMIGIMKTLTVGAVAGTSDGPAVYTGSTAITIVANSTAGNLYVNLNTPYASATLIGLTTALWGVVATHGTVVFSTST